MPTLQHRIREAMRRHPELRPADIARGCGVTTASVSGWIHGQTKSLKPEPARRASLLFGCDQNWLATGTGTPKWMGDSTKEVAHALSVRPAHDVPRLRWEAIVQRPDELPERFEVTMPDDALAPNIVRGTDLIFERSRTPAIGDGVLVQDKSGKCYVRRYAEGLAGEWAAQALNGAYVRLESGRDGLRILAVLAWRRGSAV